MDFFRVLSLALAVAAVVDGISRDMNITHGRFLNNNIYRILTLPTVYQCVELCSASTFCASINFRAATKECFLNRDDPSKPLFQSSKYSHIYLRDAPETLTLPGAASCPPHTWYIPGNGGEGTCIPEEDTCVDINIWCPNWRDNGQCNGTGSFNFVKFSCRQSCNTCHLPSPLN